MACLLVAQVIYAFKQHNTAMEVPRHVQIPMVMTRDSTCTHVSSH